MLGGYQILDLRSIDLSRATSEASISDADVLMQLLNIRKHIQKDYDFSKSLQNQLKPLLIRYRDKKVGEKHEVALFGNIEVINTYYKFRIVANNEGEQLTINVEFEEKTDDYSNKYWDIKTAKILLTSEQPIFEEITDKDGHKRFIEGNGLVSEITGLTNTYCKWALSGTHLLLVCAGKLADETVINAGTVLCQFEIPKWVYDKIYPVWGDAYIEYKAIDCRADNWVGQTLDTALYKGSANIIGIIMPSTLTLTDDRGFRIEFDLLIDNE